VLSLVVWGWEELEVVGALSSAGEVFCQADTCDGKNGVLFQVQQPISRCETLLEFANAANIPSSSTHARTINEMRMRIIKHRATADEIRKELAAKRDEYEEQIERIKRMQQCRRFPNHAYTACNATCLTKDLIEKRREVGEACKRLEMHKLIWEASDPLLCKPKDAISLKDWEEKWSARIEEFAAERSPPGGVLDQNLRGMMLALVLLRLEPKKDACAVAMHLFGKLHEFLPHLLKLCIARCSALLPYYSDTKNPFSAGGRLYTCPLAGPTSSGKDKMRVPLPVDEYRLASDVGVNDEAVMVGINWDRKKWKDVGSVKPGVGHEIQSEQLARALLQKKLTFTTAEWKGLGVAGALSPACYIKVGDRYYKPRSVEKRVSDEPAFALLRDIRSWAPMCKINNEWVLLREEVLMVTWKGVGATRPEGGDEIQNEQLARALQQKLTFTESELQDVVKMADLSPASFTKGLNGTYYTPDVMPGFLVARAQMGSAAVVHPMETSTLQPCLMIPEGSPGITELFTRILVELSQMNEPQTWVFHFMYPKKEVFPEEERRSPSELLYAWFASAARQCAEADKKRIKELLAHMQKFLQVAGRQLIRLYPKQTAKVAATLQAAPEVARSPEFSKGQPSVSALVGVLAEKQSVGWKEQELEKLQAQADAAQGADADADASPEVNNALEALEQQPPQVGGWVLMAWLWRVVV
jgi:hypothetical protein